MSKRRPNRAHGAIDKLPPEIQLQIKDWYLGRPDEEIPRLTYEQIAEQLRALGHKVAVSQVHRWIARQRDELERIQTARERAQMLAKYLVPDGTDVEQAAVSLAGALCLEALSDADIQQVKSIEDLAKVSNSLGRLQTSSVQRDRWETEKRKKIEAAVQQLNGEIQFLLQDKPELMKAILVVVDQAKQKMTENAA